MISSEYNEFIRHTRFYEGWGTADLGELAYLTLGLSGESGEFADEIKKIARTTGFHDDIAFHGHMTYRANTRKVLGELGDTLWYVNALCIFFNITIEELMILNTFKLYNRLIQNGKYTKETLPWPYKSLSYADASRLMQVIESRIIRANALTSMGTDTESKQ